MKLRMEGFVKFVFIISLFVFGIQVSYGSSISCQTLYDQGGISAVVESPECSQQLISNRNQAMKCQFAAIKSFMGQEDAMSCNLDMEIPFPGKNGIEYVKVGVVGIFDSLFSFKASDMASKLLLDYFLAHTALLSSNVSLMYDQEKDPGYNNLNAEGISPKTISNATSHVSEELLNIEESTHRRILKEALLRTLRDIESTFLKEASEKELHGGTLATVAVLVHGHILVANIGNSKAFLCSDNIKSMNGTEGMLLAKELTQDHTMAREDERSRVLAITGGRVYVMKITRALGFFKYFKRIGGLIAEPEVTDWQLLTSADAYLIFQTEEVSRKLGTPQNVCNLVHSQHSNAPPSECGLEASLAECIAFSASHKRLMPVPPCPRTTGLYGFSYNVVPCDIHEQVHHGIGMDLSAVVVPLFSSGFLRSST